MELTHCGPLGQDIRVEESSQVGQVRRQAQALATRLGFDENDAGRTALVATELATNVIRHGRGGWIHLQAVPDAQGGLGVELCALDQGPGLDMAACLQDGYSTGGTPGIGLGAVKRNSDLLESWSDAKGAIVLARVLKRGATDLALGARRRAMDGGQFCGDGWYLTADTGRMRVCLVDGLGHGPDAAKVADAAAEAFIQSRTTDPALVLAQLNTALAGTRGGAAAVACLEGSSGQLSFSGIGNIAGRLLSPVASRGLASLPGIVGVQFRKAQTFDFPDSGAALLVLHSDGLQTRWDLQHYPGLIMRHPSLIAAVLLRDFDRGRDDSTLVLMRLATFQ
jgi:anti-sigma regulatory factor (Ser/Thr protein kinase)